MASSALVIEYYADDGVAAATELQNDLAHGNVAADVKRATAAGGELGVTELVITFVAAKMARAVAEVALRHIQQFLREKIEASEQRLRVRVVVPRPGGPSRKLPFSLQTATLETLETFCKDIEKALDAL